MKRAFVVGFIVGLVATWSFAARGSDLSNIDKLLSAATKLTQWFSGLETAVVKIGDKAERDRLRDQLITLNKSLFEVEYGKRLLVLSLQRPSLDKSEIRSGSHDMVQKVIGLRQAVLAVGPSLRLNGGDEAAALLREASTSRKAWVEELQRALDRGEAVDPKPLIEKGEAAIKSLEEADKALAKVIKTL